MARQDTKPGTEGWRLYGLSSKSVRQDETCAGLLQQDNTIKHNSNFCYSFITSVAKITPFLLISSITKTTRTSLPQHLPCQGVLRSCGSHSWKKTGLHPHPSWLSSVAVRNCRWYHGSAIISTLLVVSVERLHRSFMDLLPLTLITHWITVAVSKHLWST